MVPSSLPYLFTGLNVASALAVLGAIVGEFVGARSGLGTLLMHLAEIPGIERLRYSTSHPRDVEDTLIAAHRHLPQLMPRKIWLTSRMSI